MLILNDLHLSVQRKSGTTPTSQEALRSYLFGSFQKAVAGSHETHLLILGDLFDEFEVAPRDWLDTYLVLSQWLSEGKRLTLVAGNHDHSPKAMRVSSFGMLAKVLDEQSGNVNVISIDEFKYVAPHTAALAHCSNQTAFDTKLKGLLEDADLPQYLLLHANYNNEFAERGDHSLNVSVEQAEAFTSRGTTLVFAHEHQARSAFGGKVFVMGNQWPSSIADCQHNPGNTKFAHVLHDGRIDQIVTWSADEDAGYVDVPWHHLDQPIASNVKFVRVSGDATSAQAAEVITAIAKFRRESDAFVVSNAVRIDGIVETEELPASFEVAKTFDVMQYIRQHLDEAEIAVVEGLMQEQS